MTDKELKIIKEGAETCAEQIFENTCLGLDKEQTKEYLRHLINKLSELMYVEE